MRKVTAGEPMLPHFTASWFNQTINLDKKFGTGDQGGINTKHQNIIDCVNNSSNTIDQYNSVRIGNRVNPLTQNTSCYLYSGVGQSWGVAQQKIAPGATGKVCVFGLTLANVVYPAGWDDLSAAIFIKTRPVLGTLRPSFHGSAEILASNTLYPSLIKIGNYEQATGMAYLEEGASPRIGGAVGFGFGTEIILDTADSKYKSVGSGDAYYNNSTEPIKRGYIQYKEMVGRRYIDVAPCKEEEPIHTPYVFGEHS